MISPKRYESGFTIVEIIAVLLLMSIIAATVMGRTINTEGINLTSQMDKARNHFRYAQSMAMKNSDAVWGFGLDPAGQDEYWVFRVVPPVVHINQTKDNANKVILPAEENITVDLAGKGLKIAGSQALFFDRFGKPYVFYSEEGSGMNFAIVNIETYSISTSSGSIIRTFTVQPETGLIR